MVDQRKAVIYALLSVFLWSTVASAFKITLRYTSVSTMLMYSTLVSALCLFIIISFQRKISELFRQSAKEILSSAVLGLLNPFLYYLILFKAYSLLPAQEALTLNYTWALMVVIFSMFFLGQKIKASSFVAILISFSGVVVIATGGNVLSLEFSNGYGVFLALISSIVWALFWIFNIKDKRDEIKKLFMNFLFGLIYILIYNIAADNLVIPLPEATLGVIYIGLFEMGITFIFWLKALKYAETTASISNLIYISPFMSLIFIKFVVGEEIHIASLLGLFLLISGIIIQKIYGKPPQTAKQ